MPYTRSPCFSRLARQARILGDGRERQRITEKQGRVEAIDGRHLERVTTEGARQGHGERSRLELLFKLAGTRHLTDVTEPKLRDVTSQKAGRAARALEQR